MKKRKEEGRTYVNFKEICTYVNFNIGRTNVAAALTSAAQTLMHTYVTSYLW
jgi:hypothetical protein